MKRVELSLFVGWMLIACGPVVMAVASEPLGTVPLGALVLDQDWQMQSSVLIGDAGASLSMPGQLPAACYKTKVPTTVLGALIRHGVCPDPYIGTNNMMIPDANDAHNKRFDLAKFSHMPDKSNPWAKPWWFCREFQIPSDYRGKVVWLNLDGINYRADVWLNGQQIGSAKDIAGMFKRYRFDVTRQLQPGTTNARAICVHPVDLPGDPVHEQLGGINGDLGPNGGDDAIARNVTQVCTVGWDWVPAARDRNMGLFILAGQSNMEGPANISTFDYIGDDPATAPMLKKMRGADGKPATCEGAWISYLTGAGENNFTLNGKLTSGYGSMWGQEPTKPGVNIGPEFTFGLAMDAAFAEPVLIIKAAWGGKSLHTDFRPPSAGPYVMPKETQELWDKHPQGAHGIPKTEDRPRWHAEKAAAAGVYYRLMMEHVKKVLADPKQVMPDYDPAQGYEIAGFAWFQGFNDLVDSHVYPRQNQPDRYAVYSELLATFIRDVRKDLNAPKMPFVIGVMGVGGLKDQSSGMVSFRQAMAAPADMPEFKGNVAAVQTAPFWADELAAIDAKRPQINQMRHALDSKHKDHANADGKMTDEQKNDFMKKFEADLINPAEAAMWKRGAPNAGYHYLGCAKTFALIGKHLAEANLKMIKQP